MEPETNELRFVKVDKISRLHTITPLSKYLAMALFIILPFLGAWIGYANAPVKVVEVERVVVQEVVNEEEKDIKSNFLNGFGIVKDHVLENMRMGPYVELEVAGMSEPVYVIYGPYGDSKPVECKNAEAKHFSIGDEVEFMAEIVQEIDGQKPVSKIITTCYKEDHYIMALDLGDALSKDEFVGAISNVIKKDDDYYIVFGGEFGVDLVSYNIPEEGPVSKSIFNLIEDSYRTDEEYKISKDALISLISYEKEGSSDNRYNVETNELHGIYSGDVDKFYYYGLPSDEYPFEIIILNGEVTMIDQIYVE